MGNQETFWLRAIGFGHNLVDSNILWNGYAWQAPVKSLQVHFRHWPNGCLKALGFRALCGIRQLPRLPSRLHNAHHHPPLATIAKQRFPCIGSGA